MRKREIVIEGKCLCKGESQRKIDIKRVSVCVCEREKERERERKSRRKRERKCVVV
jgi:hypothetical protein